MPSLSANQVVAYNLARIRKARGLSQQQAAELLEPYLGTRWSKAVYSAAERSYDGNRVRQFTADDLLAMSLAFGVPVLYFFLPPKEDDRGDARSVLSGERDVAWVELFDAMLNGAYSSTILMRVLELPPQDRPAASTRLGQLIGLLSGSTAAIEERDRRATAARDKALLGPPGRGDRSQAVVAAIVTSDRGVLVTRRVDQNPPWGFTAGWGEPGESPEDTMIREVKEEADLRIQVGEYLGERDHPDTGKHMIYYAARPTHGTEIHLGDKGELTEVRWVSLAEADELLPGMFGPVREHLARELGEG
jgi:8-oxo-dGTP pyrophosphatase MutT (NUDIX family)/transcriptional regulator with XRE-family HTH domain